MTTHLTLARAAGVLYLLLALLGSWAHLVARGAVHVPGDAAATAAAIVEHEQLFRLSLAADILMATVFVLLGLTLYRLLDDVHRRAATALLVYWVTWGIWRSFVASASLSTSWRKAAPSIPRADTMVPNISAEGTDLSFSSYDR